MFERPSLVMRVAAGKAVGSAFGLAGLIFMPYFLPDAGWLPRFGFLLWYTTLGALIGVAGTFTRCSFLKLAMPWWFRGPCLGAWMNFVLTFFAYDMLVAAMAHTFGPGGIVQSPFWFVLEGAVVGLVIGYFVRRFGGEGRETADN